MRINYIIATWNGKRISCDEQSYYENVLNEHLKVLENVKHSLTQITIMRPYSDIKNEYYNVNLNSITKIIECENNLLSYGQWIIAMDQYVDEFDYFILVEDDYVPGCDNFDLKLIDMYEEDTYLCSKTDTRGYPFHCSISNGIISSSTIKKLFEKIKFIDWYNNYSVKEVQVSFSRYFHDNGITLKDYSSRYAVKFHNGNFSIKDYTDMNVETYESIFYPIQLVYKKSKTILFGGSGFLGNIFLRDYPYIISVGRTKPESSNLHINIKDFDSLDVLDDLEFDNVIFLIGNSNHHHINNNNLEGIEYNVIPLKKILYYLQNRKINKFVSFSTILLYGNKDRGRPVNEQDEIFPYQNDYVFSKYLAEQVVEFYKNRIPIINVRLCNIYGDTKLVRPDLIPTLIHDSLTKNSPEIWNDKPIRDFIFTSDAAEAIIKIMDTDFTGNINIGTGESYPVSKITEIVEELSGKKITSLDISVDGVMKFVTDISLLKKYTGWNPKYSLREGLEKTYNIMKKIN